MLMRLTKDTSVALSKGQEEFLKSTLRRARAGLNLKPGTLNLNSKGIYIMELNRGSLRREIKSRSP